MQHTQWVLLVTYISSKSFKRLYSGGGVKILSSHENIIFELQYAKLFFLLKLIAWLSLELGQLKE
jgi:hypothetical protein